MKRLFERNGLSLQEIILLPLRISENFLEIMKDTMNIKYVYSTLIYSNIFFMIYSIALNNPKISFYYSIGTFILAFYLYKTYKNDMLERALFRVGRKIKDIDYDTFKNEVYTKVSNLKDKANKTFSNRSFKISQEIDDDEEMVDEELDF